MAKPNKVKDSITNTPCVMVGGDKVFLVKVFRKQKWFVERVTRPDPDSPAVLHRDVGEVTKDFANGWGFTPNAYGAKAGWTDATGTTKTNAVTNAAPQEDA